MPIEHSRLMKQSRLMEQSRLNEALRVTLTVTLCMLIGKFFDFSSPVYFALYPTIIMTKGKDYSWYGLAKTLLPTLMAASCAVVVSEIFADHPFIIWTISLIFFDQLRRRATTPAKQGAMLMPTFNWILIIVFSQHTTMNMPERIHEIFLAMLITAIMAKIMVALFPIARKGPPPVFTPHPVSYQNRLVSLSLIGSGLAFLMMVDMISATFCMVPVVAAAIQQNRDSFALVVKRRLLTQVGGCAIAVIFTLLMAGHQHVIGFYALGLGGLIYLLAYSMANAEGTEKDIHADALLATLLPIQLYMSSTDLGLENTFLRAWELTVTLIILLICHQLTQPHKDKNTIRGNA
ncbi:DUF2955 domain-containing protein [Photobacterium nomapromontoriensis]|uniref:DUF2955 domain-containing protein n=1 Tax=Photobacterium nomapromontoriensis TaxID=2910237 RepID=UPI003D0D77B1